MRWQAMHHQGIRLRVLQQSRIELVRCQDLQPLGLLSLLPHTDPDIGIDHIGVFHRDAGVGADFDCGTGLLRLDSSQIHDASIRLIPRRTAHGNRHAGLGRSLNERIRHIVAVTDIRDLDTLQAPFSFLNGQQVGQGLAGMIQIGEAVDDRNAGLPCPLLGDGVIEGPQDDGIQVARQHMRRIRHCFPAGQLNVAHRQHHGLAAELIHSGLERDTGPGRRLLEQQAQHTPWQEGMRYAATLLRFQLRSEPQ